jgi:hypothetical protein
MAKRVDLTITIDLPQDYDADRLSIGPDGRVRVFDKSGNEITSARLTRAAHYDRPKGRKYQARSEGDSLSVGGLEELAGLDSFIAIDTNSTEINGTKISAACFMVWKLIAKKDGFHLKSVDERHHVYEFHNASGNPEMLAILKVACDTVRAGGPLGKSKIAFITDSDLMNHQAISNRKTPIYGRHYLPKGFMLIYASADTGRELANKLVRLCDTGSSRYIDNLQNGAFRTTGLASLEHEPSVLHRYTYYPGLSILNPIVKGATITPGTKLSIAFE